MDQYVPTVYVVMQGRLTKGPVAYVFDEEFAFKIAENLIELDGLPVEVVAHEYSTVTINPS